MWNRYEDNINRNNTVSIYNTDSDKKRKNRFQQKVLYELLKILLSQQKRKKNTLLNAFI